MGGSVASAIVQDPKCSNFGIPPPPFTPTKKRKERKGERKMIAALPRMQEKGAQEGAKLFCSLSLFSLQTFLFLEIGRRGREGGGGRAEKRRRGEKVKDGKFCPPLPPSIPPMSLRVQIHPLCLNQIRNSRMTHTELKCSGVFHKKIIWQNRFMIFFFAPTCCCCRRRLLFYF